LKGEIVGRQRELTEVFALLDAPGHALIVVGEPGMGKSTLLDAAAERAGGAGWQVLRADGSERETDLAFAALHQLLRPVLGGTDRLPARQRSALLGAFGVDDEPVAPDRLLIGMAVLTLLSDREQPLLVVVDDAQWIDRGSLDALAFAARRLDGVPVALLAAARGRSAPPGLDNGVPAVTLGPLAPDEANRLLDLQPLPPSGRTRLDVLSSAAGNPLALVELARTVGGPCGKALPLTARLEAIFAADVADLPAPTRHLLLLASAADGDLAHVLAAGTASADLGDWLPAERAGLVHLDGRQVRFRHPLVRSGIYQAASFAERRTAHLTLAEALRDQPDRRAWHLAAASAGPDEAVAAALEATADRARQRGGYAAAARALERAAELSPDTADRARRLALGADAATFTGQLGWVQELAARVPAYTSDPAVLALAAHSTGWALSQTTRHRAALAVLLPAAATGGQHAAVALVNAALTAYHTGEEPARRDVLRAASRMPLPADNPWRIWIVAATDPFGQREDLLASLAKARTDNPLELGALGAAAWTLDETAQAVDLLEAAIDGRRAAGALGGSGSTFVCLGRAYADQGRWAEAETAAAAAAAIAAEGQVELVAAGTLALEASLLAVRGHTVDARDKAAAALAAIDPRQSRAIAGRARHAAGLAATADGDHELAYEHFRTLFTRDGDPDHFHGSWYAVADLAAAAARTGRRDQACEIVDRLTGAATGGLSTRLVLLTQRARALLVEVDNAEPHFLRAATDPAGTRWPFERAQAELEYAQWLRRRRRGGDARPLLLAALETFRRLGARGWTELAHAELRASGVSLVAAEPDALADLTPQQQQIIRLAARGLTNKEIAEQLFLSPRTVATHLYRSFPKLGITARAQLRDILP
jgi:DNA-binding CsgD family transcriptional regulator